MIQRHSLLVAIVLALFTSAWSFAAPPPTRPATKPPAKADGSPKQSQSKKREAVTRELVSGRVVMLREALEKRGITSYKEMASQVGVVTVTVVLVPIVSYLRGRALIMYKRLRGRPVDLVVRRRKDIPYLQVVMIYTFDKKGVRQYTDYWCEICSIAMYEIKPCECCQAPIELRFQEKPLPGYLTGTGKAATSKTAPRNSSAKPKK